MINIIKKLLKKTVTEAPRDIPSLYPAELENDMQKLLFCTSMIHDLGGDARGDLEARTVDTTIEFLNAMVETRLTLIDHSPLLQEVFMKDLERVKWIHSKFMDEKFNKLDKMEMRLFVFQLSLEVMETLADFDLEEGL